MRSRHLVVVSLFSIVLAACGGPDTALPGAPEGSDQPEEVLLSYNIAAGDTFVYEVALDQAIKVISEGEGGAPGSEEDLPGEADVEISATGTFTFTVADGPRAGTYEITISGDLSDVTATGTVDGEPIDSDEIPEFAGVDPVETTVIVDEKGNLINDTEPADALTGSLLGGMMGGMAQPGVGMIPGVQLGQFFGPVLGDDEVTVGDSWTTTNETPGLGEEPIVTSSTSTVTGTDTVDGTEVLVIETDASTDAFELDLGAFLVGLLGGFTPDSVSPEEQAEIDALMENLRFVMSFDDTSSKSTARFDPEAGLNRAYDLTSMGSIAMDLNLPDDETGEMLGLTFNMTIEQTVSHTLVEAPSV